jgi:hypothetical protein
MSTILAGPERDSGDQAAAPGTEPVVRAVTRVAIGAYAAACPLLPFTDLSYPDARAHRSGDTLAEFLVIELTEGSEGASPADRFRRAADQVEFAIGSLELVRDRLRERAASSTSLPLPLDHTAAPGAAAQAS